MPLIYRINLQLKKISAEQVGDNHPFEFYAGRSLSSKIVAEEVLPMSDALSNKNKLIISSGFLGGTSVPNSGRLSIGSKSPLTGGVKESNVGGRAPAMLAALDIRAIILEEISKNWVIIKVQEENLEILDASKYIRKNNYELVELLKKEFGDKIGGFVIGQAGEKLFKCATIASIDMEGYPSRHAGRGGLGAVMGSKKVKAIVVIPPQKNKIEYSNREEFKEITKKWFSELYESKKIFSKYGTALGISGMNATYGLPTHNFRRGSFNDCDKISADALNAYLEKNHGKYSVPCSPGCAIRCSNIIIGPDGNHITSSLEYETIALNGSNLLINDIEKLAWLNRYYEDYGIDTIEGGNIFAVLMEAGKLKWGDADGIINLMKGISTDNPDSLDIGLGCYELGVKLGVKRIAHVKKQGFPGYDPRSYVGMGVTYCTSPMGADHTAGPAIMKRKAYASKNYGEESPWEPSHKVLLSKELQIFIMILDSMGVCYFVGPSYESTQIFAQLLKLRYGTRWNKTAEDLIEWGKQCLLMEHDFNIKAGITIDQDKLPQFILNEPLEDVDRRWQVNPKELDEFWTNMK